MMISSKPELKVPALERTITGILWLLSPFNIRESFLNWLHFLKLFSIPALLYTRPSSLLIQPFVLIINTTNIESRNVASFNIKKELCQTGCRFLRAFLDMWALDFIKIDLAFISHINDQVLLLYYNLSL